MVEIIPAILSNELKDIFAKLEQIKNLTRHLHFDIVDGKFANNRTIDLQSLAKIDKLKKFQIGLHLIVDKPINYINLAKLINPKVIIGQIEMMNDQEQFIDLIKNNSIEAGLALAGDDTLDKLNPTALVKTDYVLLYMGKKIGVSPGDFQEERLSELQKLSSYRKTYNLSFKICVDGGINKDTIKSCYDLGADIFIVGNAFWSSKDIKKTMEELNKLLIR